MKRLTAAQIALLNAMVHGPVHAVESYQPRKALLALGFCIVYRNRLWITGDGLEYLRSHNTAEQA